MYIPLEPEGYYHVYNHAVGKENLFSKEDNYYFDMSYSLKKYNSQTIVIADQNDLANTSLEDHYVTFTLGFRF